MSRPNTIQVLVTDTEIAILHAGAKAAGRRLSGYVRSRLFRMEQPTCRGYLAPSLAEAEEWSQQEGVAEEAFPWPLILVREHQGPQSSVFEVLEAPSCVPGLKLTHTDASRLVIAGSPWPYRVLENYSYSMPSNLRTVLRVAPIYDEFVGPAPSALTNKVPATPIRA